MSDAITSEKTAAQGQWWVEVRGKAYGPYAYAQLSQFVDEGRVRPTTLVSDRPDGAWVEARKVIGLIAPSSSRPANDAAAGGANIFVHAEIRSGAWNAFMSALESMGAICELSSGLWLLRTRYSAGIIRNTLSQTLEQGDRFVVIDASRDRFAWFNLGPEVDVRVAKVWNGPVRAEAIV
ncbi:MAG: GYF domain-containing protein [Terricaulis sp.]